jgi:hypothetical protein
VGGGGLHGFGRLHLVISDNVSSLQNVNDNVNTQVVAIFVP